MDSYRVKLIQPVGWTVTAKHTYSALSLAYDWAEQGYWEVSITYKGEEPHSTEDETLLIPWHMVMCIDPVPYPNVTSDVT